MKATIHIRFNQLLTSLKNKNYIINQVDLAKQYGCTIGNITNIKSGNSDLPYDMLKWLSKTYNVSADWLLSGIGTMYLEEKTDMVSEPPAIYGKALEDKEKIIELQEKLLQQYEKTESKAKAG